MTTQMSLIKNVFFISIITLSLFSCNKSHEDFEYNLSAYPIDKVTIDNDTMGIDQIQNIYTFSTYDLICRRFYAYDFKQNDLVTEVYGWSSVPDYSCSKIPKTQDSIIKSTFIFIPPKKGDNILKFWKGIDSQGNSEFIEIKIHVK